MSAPNTTAGSYNYRRGMAVLAESGHLKAFGNRVLCRAIMREDSYNSTLTIVEYNSAEAECFEVLAVGGNVSKRCAELGEEPLEVGQHIEVSTTAADRIGNSDPTGRFWLVDVQDITARTWPVAADDPRVIETLIKVEERIQARSTSMT